MTFKAISNFVIEQNSDSNTKDVSAPRKVVIPANNPRFKDIQIPVTIEAALPNDIELQSESSIAEVGFNGTQENAATIDYIQISNVFEAAWTYNLERQLDNLMDGIGINSIMQENTPKFEGKKYQRY